MRRRIELRFDFLEFVVEGSGGGCFGGGGCFSGGGVRFCRRRWAAILPLAGLVLETFHVAAK